MSAQRWIKFFEDGLSTLMDLHPQVATPCQVSLGERLAEDLRELATSGKSGEGSEFWRATCAKLERLATESDPMFFMRWDPIRATMVHGAATGTFMDWWMLRRSEEWRNTWAPALSHKQYGHPPPFPPGSDAF